LLRLFAGRPHRAVAALLLARVEYYVDRYGRCPEEDFRGGIASEVPAHHLAFSGTRAQIAPPELPDLQFFIGPPSFGGHNGERELSVLGRGQFTSFGLVAGLERSSWFCYAGGGSIRPSRAAKQLAKELSAFHGIADADNMHR